MADSSARLSRLYNAIFGAAFYLALSIGFVEPLAYRCLDFRLALGSLLASSFLFLIPLTLLAMTGPFLVRVLTFSVQNVGGNAGRLTAVSTLGSVAGTVLIGYVLVPLLPNSATLFLTATVLLVLVLGYYAGWGRRSQSGLGIGVGIAIALLGGWGGVRRNGIADYTGAREIFRGNSNFGLLQVLENTSGTRRLYLNDFLTQNTYDPHTGQSLSLFTYMLHDLARAYAPRVNDALCIGLGVGMVPMQLAREGVTVDVVEINPAVIPVAAHYFGLDPSRLKIELGDGRAFLNKARSRLYDVTVMDAFLGDSSPSHLMTREAFTSVRRVLKEDGVLVINVFGDFSRERGFLTASLDKTLHAVFSNVRIHAAGNGNVFFVASARPQLEVLHRPDFARIPGGVRAQAEVAFDSIRTTDPDLGQVLTDDYNPVEFRDAKNREAWRRQLALSMQPSLKP